MYVTYIYTYMRVWHAYIWTGRANSAPNSTEPYVKGRSVDMSLSFPFHAQSRTPPSPPTRTLPLSFRVCSAEISESCILPDVSYVIHTYRVWLPNMPYVVAVWHIYIHVHMHIHIHIHIYIYVYIFTYGTCIYTYTYVHTAHLYLYIYIYTYVHTAHLAIT